MKATRSRSRGMGSVIAVATLGLCAVAVASVATLVRMDWQRTAAAADEAQAVELLRVGADAAYAALIEDLPAEHAERSVPLPDALARGGGASLIWVTTMSTTEQDTVASIVVDAEVGDAPPPLANASGSGTDRSACSAGRS
ncbi:MAG: hypothetical protein AAGE65_11865, partial [Planctomycetota bacterium]